MKYFEIEQRRKIRVRNELDWVKNWKDSWML